jgi:hypothetical protein
MFRKKQTPPERRSTAPRTSLRSNAVFSYHANRDVRARGDQYRDADREERQNEAQRRGVARRSWLRRLPGAATLLAVVVVTLFCLQLDGKAKVIPVGTSEGQKLFLRDKSIYENAAWAAFSSLANRNKLTVNAEKISGDLKRQFPELQAVSVSLPVIGSRPSVYIQPAVPRLILIAQNGIFVLDGSGRALISGNQVPQLSNLAVPAVTDQSGLAIQTGSIALPRATVSFIAQATGQLKAKGLTPNSLVLPPGTNELHVRLDGIGYLVKFNLHGQAREETGAFLAARQHLEAEHKSPHEYIDVRVENKVFYK